MPSNEHTFTHAYKTLVDETVLEEPTNWRTESLDQAKGRSNRAMFILSVDLSEPAPNDKAYRLSCLRNDEPRRVYGIPDADLGLRRDAGISVEFFGSNDSPHGPQVWGAYGSPDLYLNETEFYVGTVEPYASVTFAQGEYAGRRLAGGEKRRGKSMTRESAWLLDHYVKRSKRATSGDPYTGYEASAVGYSPMAVMLGSEGNNHILVRVSQVNGKNIMTPYLSAGFDARIRETSRSAHPSDVLGVMHTTAEGDRAAANFSDSSGAEHSNSWFMTLSDNIISRIRISLTDTANNDIASFTSNNRRMQAGDGVPFGVVLRADVIRNVDNERVQSQQTARGVTYTAPHRFLSDTSVEGTNEAPYTNKPVF